MACANPHRAEIDSALVAGEPSRQLARRFGISATALRGHKAAHLSPALIAVAQEAGAPEVRNLVDRLRRLVAQAEAVLDAAVTAKNGSQALAAIREVRATLELVGRATGELKERPAVSLNLQTSSEWAELRAAIVDAVPPELRSRMAKRLKVIEGGKG